jgi:hypothetical protein
MHLSLGSEVKHKATELVLRQYGGKDFKAKPGNADDPRLDPPFVGQFVRPRFVPGRWLYFLEINTRLKSAVEEIATASVGLGARGIPDPEELELSGGFGRNITGQVEDAARRITRFCQKPKFNSFLPLSHELARAEIDYLASGNGYLEVVEENKEAGGAVVGLGHVRAALMRTNALRTLWVQAVQADLYEKDSHSVQYGGRYYRVYGDDDPRRRFIDRATGEFFSVWPSKLPEGRKGTAIIHACSYNPLDPYYGMPVQVPALNAILENDMMGRFMIAFLEGGLTAPVLIIAEGGQLTTASSEKIDAMFNSGGKGYENAGKAIVIQPNVNGALGTQTKIRVERVELGMKDLAPLFDRRSVNDGEILESTRMSGVFIGGTEGGSTTTRNAAVLKQLSFEHAIEPRATFWEAVLTNGIAPRFGPGVKFRFTRPKNLDPLQVASLLAKLQKGMTVNDMRQAVRTLVNGVDMPVLDLGEDGELPMPMLEAKLAQELERVKASGRPELATTPIDERPQPAAEKKPSLKLA